jgi:hypothetical protein
MTARRSAQDSMFRPVKASLACKPDDPLCCCFHAYATDTDGGYSIRCHGCDQWVDLRRELAGPQ